MSHWANKEEEYASVEKRDQNKMCPHRKLLTNRKTTHVDHGMELVNVAFCLILNKTFELNSKVLLLMQSSEQEQKHISEYI
jgi:hypothetical protein